MHTLHWLSLVLAMAAPSSLAQNPLEQLQVGAMTLAAGITNAMQNGGAVGKDIALDTPIFKVHSRTKIGMGDAMRVRNTDDSDSDSDSGESGRRRRRRRREAIEWHKEYHARHKRSPCMGGGTTGGGTGGGTDGGGTVDYDEQLQERRRRARQRKRATKRQARKKKSRGLVQELNHKLRARKRSRRQAAAKDSDDAMANVGNQISEHAQKFANTMNNIWDAFVGSLMTTVQQVRQTVTGGRTNGGADAAQM